VAGSILLGGFALLIYAVMLYGAGDEEMKAPVLGAGLLVTLFGLTAFEEVLRERGERLLPRFGSVSFAIAAAFFVAIALYGWSILRSKALSTAIGWFAMAWAVFDGYM